MSSYSINESTLTGIADAIRFKLKTTDGIKPEEMRGLILTIGGIDIENSTVELAQSVYVNDGSESTNYNDKDFLRVGCGSSSSVVYYTLLKFPLDSITGDITSAKLRLYSYSNECWNASISQSVKLITEDWDQTTTTWANKPAVSSDLVATSTVSGYDKWYEWDVTELVKAQVAGENYGLCVMQSNSTTSKAKCFKRTGEYAPQLVIEYAPMV